MTVSGISAMPGSYDYGEVARSVFIAIVASYVALDLAGRVTATKGRIRLAWSAGGAAAMGIGIFEMHLKGMLAFRLPVPVFYHWPTLFASLLVAFFAAAVAMYVVSRPKMSWVQALTGSIVMGGGIAGLHYIAMAAMRLPAIIRYSSLLVTASTLLAVLFSLIALLLAFDLRLETKWTARRRLGSAVLMGAAVSAMHYTGMAAASFFPSSPPDLSRTVSISPAGDFGVVIVTLIVLLAALITSSVDKQAEAEVRLVNEELERRVEERTSQLAGVNQELKRWQDQLRLVIDTIPALVWSKLPDGSADFFNQRFREYTGLPLQEGLGEGWMSAIHPEDFSKFEEEWHAALLAGEPFDVEARLRRADGQYRWFLLRGVPLRDERGNIVKWYGTTTDIEDRKQAEDDLRKQKDILQKVLDTIPAMVWSALPDGSIDFVNQRWLDYFGRPLEKVLGHAWMDALHPEDRDRTLEKWRPAITRGEPVEVEARLRRADGEYCWFVTSGVPLRDELGKIVKWYGTKTDIEDRKQAEQDLRESETRLRAFFKNSPNLIFMKDPQGRYLYVNQEVERVLRITEAQIEGKRDDEIFPPEHAAGYQANDRQVLHAGSPMEFEEIFVREDGPHTTIVHKFPLFNAEGAIYAIGGVATDITERKHTEEALQEAHARLAHITRVMAMGELAAAIAHEVNQPLAAIVTNANFCLRQLAGTAPNLEKLREAIAEITNDGTRASAVISRIRALLQKGAPERVELDINRTIHEVSVLLRDELTRNRVRLRADLAADIPRVSGDPVQLQQVLINLVMNGVDAMRSLTRRPRELLIKSSRNHNEVFVQIQDSGEGLDPQEAERIFQPFFTTKPDGIGMGLTICRSIIESHGGRLWAESGPKGALFQFTLPIR